MIVNILMILLIFYCYLFSREPYFARTQERQILLDFDEKIAMKGNNFPKADPQ